MEWIEPYEIACIQSAARSVPVDLQGRDEAIGKNLSRILELIDYVTAFGHSRVRLVVLPEYGINGAWRYRPLEDWLTVATTIPGKWTDLLAEKARQRNIHICANMLEVNDEWPGRLFNTTFIIDPKGEVILKHWKHINNAFTLPYTTPADIYDEFVARYGQKGLFPVVDTPLGKLATLTCAEVFAPEISRANALNGAEVLLHPTSEFQGPKTDQMSDLKIARATENSAYFVSANVGEFLHAGRGQGASRGQSMLISHEGRVIGRTVGPGEATLQGLVDINALRDWRAHNDLFGILRTEMFAEEYRRAIGWPNNAFLKNPIKDVRDSQGKRVEVLARYYEAGILERPFAPRERSRVQP